MAEDFGMKYLYKILLVMGALAFFPAPVWAFKCPNSDIAQTYKDSDRAFLIYITQTRLDQNLWSELNAGNSMELQSEESVKAIFADCRIIEDFKGDVSYKPTLVDLLGIGTGYIGLTPGKYYFVMLPPLSKDETSNIRYLSMCDVGTSYYRLSVDRFQKELDQFRSLRDSK